MEDEVDIGGVRTRNAEADEAQLNVLFCALTIFVSLLTTGG